MSSSDFMTSLQVWCWQLALNLNETIISATSNHLFGRDAAIS